MADIFVSYTSADRGWAHWIAKELASLGHAPHVHEWEINAGEDIYAWMEAHHDSADHILCVFSDEYLKAPYSTLEKNAAAWQAANKRPRFILPVVVKPCRLPTLSDHLLRCELFDLPEDAARRRFTEFMSKREVPSTAVFPGRVVAVSNVPIGVPEHFMGREDALAEIERTLQRSGGRVAITALHGLRGVGKTLLAAAYAERHRNDYRTTWWLRAQTEAGIRIDLVALGVRLGWITPDVQEEPALEIVAERLRHEGEGILLIYDNAIDANALKPHLPRGGAARVLVTSNTHAWRGVAEPVEITLWPKAVGADYLIARTGRSAERSDAEALSETLGGLPLAHEQAAAYCERLEIPLAEYTRRFAETPIRLLDSVKDAPAEFHDRLTVAKAFALAIEQAAKLHAAAEPLLCHAASMAPEAIPQCLFAQAREEFGEPLASALREDGLDEALAALRAFALINRERISDERDPTIMTDTIRLHRLVREIAVGQLSGEEERLRLKMASLRAVYFVYPKQAYQDPKAWPWVRRLDALACALAMDDWPPSTEEFSKAAIMLNELAAYRMRVLAAYGDGELLLRRLLAITEASPTPNDPEVASSLHILAMVLAKTNRWQEAKPLLDRALAIDQTSLRPDHPNIGKDLTALADFLQSANRAREAEPLGCRALEIAEANFGPDDPEVATCLSNLARIFQETNQPQKAEPLLRRALAIDKACFGLDHPNVGLRALRLAGVLASMRQLSEAERLTRQALEISEASLFPNHPQIADCLNLLACLLTDTNTKEQAERLFRRALEIDEACFGPNHPQVARDLRDLAHLLHIWRRLVEAEPLLRRALAICEASFGPAHPKTIDTRNRHDAIRGEMTARWHSGKRGDGKRRR